MTIDIHRDCIEFEFCLILSNPITFLVVKSQKSSRMLSTATVLAIPSQPGSLTYCHYDEYIKINFYFISLISMLSLLQPFPDYLENLITVFIAHWKV
jgi:hypothetical protein